MPRLLRLALVALTALATFLVAGSALAASARGAAPLCDDRGATRLAAPPTVQLPQRSLEAATVEDRACDERHDVADSYRDGQRGPETRSPLDGEAALPVRPPRVAGPGLTRTAEVRRSLQGRRGVRARVDRPPRV